jgi:hypothetical protein
MAWHVGSTLALLACMPLAAKIALSAKKNNPTTTLFFSLYMLIIQGVP